MKKFLVFLSAAVFLCLPVGSAQGAGNDIDLSGLLQADLKNMVQELGLAVSVLPMGPAEPLGITGFDAGVEVTLAQIDHEATYWKNSVADTDAPAYLSIPKLHIQKGLPFGVDVGAIYAYTPGSNISLVGGEVKWAWMDGSTVLPAVAFRASYSKLMGVDELDLQTIGLDASVSKGFGPLTPYAGFGILNIRAEEHAGLGLADVDTNVTRSFVGSRLSFLVFDLMAQADFSEIPLYSVRLNMGF